MLRHLGLIAVCACIVASVGCDGESPGSPSPTMVTVEFGGRVVNADAGGPVANVRVSVSAWSSRGAGLYIGWAYAEGDCNVRWRWHIYPPTQSPE